MCNAKEKVPTTVVENTLNYFKLHLKSNIVASTHDGVAVMVKLGNATKPEAQIYYNHDFPLGNDQYFFTRDGELLVN